MPRLIPESPTFTTPSERELVVVGDLETVRRVAGDDVARRLGL